MEHRLFTDGELAGVEVSALRGTILDAAERVRLGSRFVTGTASHRAAVVVTDLESGRSTLVPLFAYGPVREALAELFPEEEE